MARITVEDCLQKVNNRFALIHMASKRVRQLRKGAEPSIVSKNRDIVISLREIAAGNIIMAEGSGAAQEPEQLDAPPEEEAPDEGEKEQEEGQ